MLISDWSSDVCSSDLDQGAAAGCLERQKRKAKAVPRAARQYNLIGNTADAPRDGDLRSNLRPQFRSAAGIAASNRRDRGLAHGAGPEAGPEFGGKCVLRGHAGLKRKRQKREAPFILLHRQRDDRRDRKSTRLTSSH